MQIAPNILVVLEAAVTEGNQLTLTGQLDRKTYVSVNDVLEAVGGKWNRKAKAHVFECDAADALEQILLTGEVITKKTIQQEYGFFPTPPAIVAKMMAEAKIRPGMTCLEPEAGRGAIAQEMRAAGGEVYCIELLPDNVKALREQQFIVTEADFLTVKPQQLYDRVLMNPPFSRQADIKHVAHALSFLNPGGRLVAIMSAGVTFRTDGRTAAFNQMLEERGAVVEPLPAGSFRESGTGVNTIMVSVEG